MNEYRVVRVKMEARASEKVDGSPVIEGYAAVFNQVFDAGYFRETIKPGAFTRAIREKQDVRCLFNDANVVLGRTKNGTLTLSEDEEGLKYTCQVAPTQAARDVHAMIMRGDVDQCSFGFIVKTEDDRYNDDGSCDRDITDCDLLDVSPVVYPAYESTSCEARNVEA